MRFKSRQLAGCLLLASLVPVAGCGTRTEAVPADFDKARATLQTALDAWRAGKKIEDLQSQSPPLIVNDPDWVAGTRLQSFRIQEPMVYHGMQARCPVQLTFVDANGKQVEKKVTFLIDTQPALVVVRGDP